MVIPKKQDFRCYKGQTWRKKLTFTQSGTAVDFTGATIESQIRRNFNDTAVVAEFDCTVNVSNGSITLALTAAETAALNPGIYVYDIKRTDGSEVQYYLYGTFEVVGRVTI